jgi:putative Mg2+ transporter-C (MgtC) family protein
MILAIDPILNLLKLDESITWYGVIVRLVVATIFGGIVGLERQNNNQSAGFRTHIILTVASALAMLTNQFIFERFGNADISRIAAGVVSGVGFLGAGAIIHRNSGARGLTTAATIWIVMCIGLACGSMNFILATGGTIVILLFLTVFKNFERKLTKQSPRLVLITTPETPILGRALAVADKFDYYLEDIRTDKEEDGTLEVSFIVRSSNGKTDMAIIAEKFEAIEGVKAIRVTSNQKA